MVVTCKTHDSILLNLVLVNCQTALFTSITLVWQCIFSFLGFCFPLLLFSAIFFPINLRVIYNNGYCTTFVEFSFRFHIKWLEGCAESFIIFVWLKWYTKSKIKFILRSGIKLNESDLFWSSMDFHLYTYLICCIYKFM